MEATKVKVLGKNRKARFNYAVIEDMECGIELKGTEVKSMKNSMFSFSDSYARIIKDELWLISFHISQYPFGNLNNHEPDRNKKLLVHKKELKRLRRFVDEKGLTLVPLNVYLKGGLVKIKLGICRGKQLHDKRQTIKNRDEKRSIERDFKQRL